MKLDDIGHDEIRQWLVRALNGEEALPRMTPDESSHVAIVRLEKTLKPATRDSLRDAAHSLLRRFCSEAFGDENYIDELLLLTAAFKHPEAAMALANLARRFSYVPQLPLTSRLAVLAALVDTPPPQPVRFWIEILKENPEDYAGLALAGVTGASPFEAVNLLPLMPNAVVSGQGAALNLELAWDSLPPKDRFAFAADIHSVLTTCGSEFSGPVNHWLRTVYPHRFGTTKAADHQVTAQSPGVTTPSDEAMAEVEREIVNVAAEEDRTVEDVVRDTVQQVSINIATVKELAEEQVRFPALAEVWIFAKNPVDLQENFYSSVKHNIHERFVKYYYFIHNVDFFTELKKRLQDDIRNEKYVNEHVFCIEVPPSAFISSPGFAIWLARAGAELHPVKGKMITGMELDGTVTEARDMTNSQLRSAYLNLRPLLESEFGRKELSRLPEESDLPSKIIPMPDIRRIQ